MRVVVIDDPDALAPYLDAWDALAVACSRPFCAPAWMLAWWREARSGDARLRVMLVLDERGLAGVGPFFAQVALGLNEMRLLGAGFSHRIGPLARPGEEAAVARELARALADSRPRPASVVFEGVDVAERWPDLIAAAWPGSRRPPVRDDVVMTAPVIDLTPSYEDWLARRERHFRKESRRTARRLQEEGIEGDLATDATAVAELLRLHHARWDDRGGSNVGDDSERVIAAAARELAPAGRLAVARLRGPDGPVAAELVVRAGTTVAFWGGGFDPRFHRLAPGTQTMLMALQDAAAHGALVADLGGGDHAYKHRLADDSAPIAWRTLFPPGLRYPLIRARLAPKHVRWALRDALRRLPPERRERLLHARKRVGGLLDRRRSGR